MSKTKEYFLRAKTYIVDLLFPIKCLGCGLELEDLEPKERWVCGNCLAKIPIRRLQTCPLCEEYSEGGRVHVKCRKKTYLDGMWVASEYSDKIVNESIKKLKFSFIKDIALPLSKIVERSVFEVEEFGEFHDILLANHSRTEDEDKYMVKEKNAKPETVLIPVPLHRKRYNWRGFNQAELISNYVARKFSLRSEAAIIIRNRHTKPQTKVESYAKRKLNMKDAFACPDQSGIAGKNVIIVDDVSTTLATMDECAKVVRKAGAKNVWGLVVARR